MRVDNLPAEIALELLEYGLEGGPIVSVCDPMNMDFAQIELRCLAHIAQRQKINFAIQATRTELQIRTFEDMYGGLPPDAPASVKDYKPRRRGQKDTPYFGKGKKK